MKIYRLIVTGEWQIKFKKLQNEHHAPNFPNIYALVAWSLFLSVSYKTQIVTNSSEL